MIFNIKFMKSRNTFLISFNVICFLLFVFQDGPSQILVGLDNWFNHETDVKTGKAFHYLWNDSTFNGYSQWGGLFVSRGAELTILSRPNVKILSKTDVYIIVDPDTTTETKSPNYILPEDIKIIQKWVKKGGVLAILANDFPNCEFTHLNQLASKFGLTFNHNSLHRVINDDFELGACTNLPAHRLFEGVSKIYINGVSDIEVFDNARAILKENGKILIAENYYGKGYVIAIGDPWLYNEYIDHNRLPVSFENLKAAENLTNLLLSHAKK